MVLFYFTIFYFQHFPKQFNLLSLQYLSFPIFCFMSCNMIFFGVTLNKCVEAMDRFNNEKIESDQSESIL